MATATITFEDVPDAEAGTFATRLYFSGGFQPDSHAHQHAQIALKLLAEACRDLGPAPEQVVEEAKPQLVLPA